MTIAERGVDDQPIRFGICIQGGDAEIYSRRDETEGCRIGQEETPEKQFPLQTGRRCCCCNYELYWSSYDKDILLRLQPTLTNDMVWAFNYLEPSVSNRTISTVDLWKPTNNSSEMDFQDLRP
jgi:hypothetical protein